MKFTTHTHLTPLQCKNILDVHSVVFGSGGMITLPEREKIIQRIEQKDGLFAVLAWDGKRLVAYKLGYKYTQTEFYSWLGAVLPLYRRKGIARKLMEIQHGWCKEQGYASICTKTKNKWMSMLILNLQCGFEVIDVVTKQNATPKILLRKQL